MKNNSNKNKKISEQLQGENLGRLVISLLRLVMAIAFMLAVYKQHWQDVFTIAGILILMFAPLVFNRTHIIKIPIEFELAAIVFAFASLYLGEVHAYYTKFWWWDIALHATSGLLFGILGFLLVYILNEHESVRLNMRPSFVAIFAFAFSVSFGAVWEVFEFTMDQTFGMNMQKSMLGDTSGLTDTMWDLIVNIFAAGFVSLFGWRNLKMQRHSLFDCWIK